MYASLQIGYTLFDQGSVTLPLDKRALQKLSQPFGLPGIVAVDLQFLQQFLLVPNPFPAFLDVALRLQQRRLFASEFVDCIDRANRHVAT
jgi:hypothetical protein